MSNDIDTNINNYTIEELMSILEISELNKQEILDKTNKYIDKFKKNNNMSMAVFFQDVQNELLLYIDETNQNKIYATTEKQTSEWFGNQALKQDNSIQNNKITDRTQKIDVFNNQHVPMNREQLGINNTHEISVAQDNLNPTLKNTIVRFVNLDSQFRQYRNGYENNSSNYTLDLSDTLKDVLNIRLYSYQIPFSWYSIDNAYGNTVFWIRHGTTTVEISMPPGNYTASQFVSMLNRSFANSFFTFPLAPISPPFPYVSPILAANLPAYYSENDGKITLFLHGGVYDNGSGTTFTMDETTQIIFYDFSGILNAPEVCVNKSRYLNQTLGWLMGYKMPYELVKQEGNKASSILDLIGPKYLILVLNDYNQNHVNNGLVSITEYFNILKVPNYYNTDLPYTCTKTYSNLSNLIDIPDNENNGLLIAGKYENDYLPTQIVVPSAPRTLTQSQIYTINEINKNRNNNTNYRTKAPTNADILAILPIKPSNTVGQLLVEFSGSLQDNSRVYFGPVNIERLSVRLLDDKGNLLNLNGSDWCFTLICECLYQY
jgi:hypothetical protein